MTVLQDLVEAAAGDTVPVATLLRQLKVIAARTDAAPLAEWVDHELQGYPDGVNVPVYRGPFRLPVLGRFLGEFGLDLPNVPIPPSTMPEEIRDSRLFLLRVRDSIAQLAEIATTEAVQVAWPADAVAYYNAGLQSGQVHPIVREDALLFQAVRTVPAYVFIGVLDAVRSRVLELALDLEKVAPDAGQADASAETKAQAWRTITNHFHAPVGNVAIASDGISQAVTVQLPGPGDEAALLRYLGAHGVDPSRLVALREALQHDRADAGGQHPPTAGARVKAWMATALTDLGTNAAGGVIGAALTAGLGAFFGG